MELTGERLIPAPIETTWAALNDPETLKACIAGCESMERTGDDTYEAVVAQRIGPVSARFRGRLTMSDIDPPNGYKMAFDGQGGAAGFGKGSAVVRLTPDDGQTTRLTYEAKATVGGKLAQIGSRLVDAAASKVADDFFAAFEATLRARLEPVRKEVAAEVAKSDVDPMLVRKPPPLVGPPRVPVTTGAWILAAIVVVATMYFLRFY